MLRHTADSRSWTARDSRCLARLFRSALGFFATQPAENIGQNQPWKQQTLAKFKSKGVISRPCLTSLLKFLKGDFSARDFLNSPKITHTSGWRMRYPCFPICVGVKVQLVPPIVGFLYTQYRDCLWKLGMTIPQHKEFTPWHFCEAFSRSVCGTTSVARASTSLAVAMCCAWKWGATSWELGGWKGWFLGDVYLFFFSKKNTPTKNNNKNQRRPVIQKDVTKGRASTINWVLLGNLVKVPGRCDLQWDHYTRVTGNLTMPWMDMNGIYMYVPYHAISYKYIILYIYTPCSIALSVPRYRYDGFLVVIMRSQTWFVVATWEGRVVVKND